MAHMRGKSTKAEMDSLNPSDMLNLCEVLYATSASLEQEANKLVISKIGAENAFFLSVCDDNSQLTCKVLGGQILEPEARIDAKNSIFEDLLQNRTHILCNSFKDNNLMINKMLGIEIHSILCLPMFHPSNGEKITNIMCLINKQSFSAKDMETAKQWNKFISPLLFKSQSFEDEKKIRKQSQALLHVVKNLLVQIDNVALLLKEIMSEAKKLTGAERCSLFLLDKEQNELVAKVFDGNYTVDGQEMSKEINIPVGEGIAGHVAVSGELLNIRDAYSHPLFYRKVDEITGFKTSSTTSMTGTANEMDDRTGHGCCRAVEIKNILCFPIKDDKGVIGVAELCNKINGSQFTYFDEELASSFSMYCAICIAHSLMWKRVRDAQRRSTLSNCLIARTREADLPSCYITVRGNPHSRDKVVEIWETKVSEDDVTNAFSLGLKSLNYFDEQFCCFQCVPRSIQCPETSLAVVSMMEDLGMVSLWKIPRKVLTRFVMSVKEGYRNMPYHNWMHAFSVAHFSFLLLKNLRLMGNHLTPLEGLCLFVSCLCHDLDHRGTTSSFQVTSKSILAALYSSEGSVLERHHFAQTMAVLHTEGCNIFENLSEEDYSQCLDYMRRIILATDLAHHFRILKDIRKMLSEGYDSSKQEHHNMLLSLLVTSCDLSDQTKDWRNTKEIAKLIYKEFFSQGDLEKAMGLEPNEMMDRSKAQIPRLQINFLQTVVLPVYELLSGFFPEIAEIVKVVQNHALQWEKVEAVFRDHYTNDQPPLEFLDDERVDNAALAV